MKKGGPIKGLVGWIFHRVAASYWSLPLVATLAALPVAYGAILIDRSGLTADLLESDLTLVSASGSAQEFASVVVGVNVALLTLYFSITLLVLTIATANLGVRLIDRWLERRFIRISLAGLTFNLVFALIVLAVIDGDAELSAIPHGTIWLLLLLEVVNVVMLSAALHDLGRTIFVDRSIGRLAKDAASDITTVVAAPPYRGDFVDRVRASQSGYVEGVDFDRLRKAVPSTVGTVRICAAVGSHVMQGETIAFFDTKGADHDAVCEAIAIGNFRSHGQGAVFQIRLLVEIAARALSPAVNDFYTALACADRIADTMIARQDSWIDEESCPVLAHDTRIELPGSDFRGLYNNPLKAMRQAAADYPSVAIRLIENYARVAEMCKTEGMVVFLKTHATDLCEQAILRTDLETDRADLRASLAKFDHLGSPA